MMHFLCLNEEKDNYKKKSEFKKIACLIKIGFELFK